MENNDSIELCQKICQEFFLHMSNFSGNFGNKNQWTVKWKTEPAVEESDPFTFEGHAFKLKIRKSQNRNYYLRVDVTAQDLKPDEQLEVTYKVSNITRNSRDSLQKSFTFTAQRPTDAVFFKFTPSIDVTVGFDVISLKDNTEKQNLDVQSTKITKQKPQTSSTAAPQAASPPQQADITKISDQVKTRPHPASYQPNYSTSLQQQPRDQTSSYHLNDTSTVTLNTPGMPKSRSNNTLQMSRTMSSLFSGLANQGATCYMNSFLQALYHIPIFTSTIFNLKTKDEIIENLQDLLAYMENEKQLASTKILTDAFGWNGAMVHTQNDPQEFCRVLIDYIDETTKNNSEDKGKIKSIFGGKTKVIVTLLETNEQIEKAQEEFLDLSLSVINYNTLQESIDGYQETEILQGSNKYTLENNKKVDAKIGTQITDCPLILQFHLMRFSYNNLTGQQQKITKEFKFSPTIQVNGIEYALYGFVVHKGSYRSGHFFAVLKPDPVKGTWYIFNDSTIAEVKPKLPLTQEETVLNSEEALCDAYLLFYYQKDKENDIFNPPHSLNDQIIQRYKKKINDLQALDTIRVFTEEGLRYITQKGKTTFIGEDNLEFSVELPQESPIQDLITEIAMRIHKDPQEIRLWQMEEFRANCIIPNNVTTGFLSPGIVFCQFISKKEPYKIGDREKVVFVAFYSKFFQTTPFFYYSAITCGEKQKCEEIAEEIFSNVSDIPVKSRQYDVYYVEFQNDISIQKASHHDDPLDSCFLIFSLKDEKLSAATEEILYREPEIQVPQEPISYADAMYNSIPDNPIEYAKIRNDFRDVHVVFLDKDEIEPSTKLTIPSQLFENSSIKPSDIINYFFIVTDQPCPNGLLYLYPKAEKCDTPKHDPLLSFTFLNIDYSLFFFISSIPRDMLELRICDPKCLQKHHIPIKTYSSFSNYTNYTSYTRYSINDQIQAFLKENGFQKFTISYVKDNEFLSSNPQYMSEFDYVRVDNQKFEKPLKLYFLVNQQAAEEPIIIETKGLTNESIIMTIAAAYDANPEDIHFFVSEYRGKKAIKSSDLLKEFNYRPNSKFYITKVDKMMKQKKNYVLKM